MSLRRMLTLLGAFGCACALAGSTALAAGEEIVVETDPLNPASAASWIDYAVSQRQSVWAVGYATCLKLLDYDEVTGLLQPEAATGMPDVSADGKTYTFTVAAGHRFYGGPGGPPGLQEAVTAASFQRALERATSPAMATSIAATPPARGLLGGVVGAAAFFDGSASSISGVQASGNTLSVELTAPDPTLLYRISMPYFCATQSDAPAGFSAATLASAGPYSVASAASSGSPPSEEHTIVLQRNPNYGGARLQNLGTIRWVQYGSPLAEDYVARVPGGYVPPSGVQIVPTITTGVQLMALNTSRAPFNAQSVRRAAAYALDRTALSGVLGWQPTDQFVSPLLPGYQDAAVYPLDGSGSATAAGLLAGATPSVTLCHPAGGRANVAALAETQLEAVGFQVTLVQPPNYFTYIRDPANCNLAMLNLSPDFPDASRILQTLFDGDGAVNLSFFDDPGFNARFDAAATMTPESARLAEYADLDADLSYAAPAIAIGHDRRNDALADRIGCRLVSQPLFGYALNRLCIQVAESAPPGGTVSTGDEATPAAPLQTGVTVPGGGAVTITQGQSDTAVPPEYTLLEQQLEISAPAQTASNPLVLTFELDATLLAAAGLTADSVAVYRNGAPIADCTGADATPDPCVASRTTQPDGDGEIVVRSSAASSWEFGERYDTSGFVQPVDNQPTLNVVNAGKTVPVRFGLGGNEGLAVLAAGSPTSVQVTCPGSGPVDSIEETPKATGGLSFDPTTSTYTYPWKTSKSWAKTCRLFTLSFREGSQLSALFRFK